jgi:hypothetical protein
MRDLLAADGPAPELAEELMLFGRFVGAWDVEMTEYAEDGSTRVREGEWHFGWVLGGRAIQDVLFEKGAPADRRGTSLRAYDADVEVWHVTWMSPAGGEFVHLIARETPSGIFQEGRASNGSLARWTFSDITDDAFTWTAEASPDGGGTWRLEQRMRARRRVD